MIRRSRQLPRNGSLEGRANEKVALGRNRFGEIDLIVSRDDDVRFVEVKTRRSSTYGHPSESVTPTKLLHLRRCIECWLLTRPAHPKKYQADVIAITALPNTTPVIEWMEGAM